MRLDNREYLHTFPQKFASFASILKYPSATDMTNDLSYHCVPAKCISRLCQKSRISLTVKIPKENTAGRASDDVLLRSQLSV